MARVTSKLQVTIPKVIANRYGIKPGADIDWLPAGDAIRVVPDSGSERSPDRARRLELFDLATERQQQRQTGKQARPELTERGWRRQDLYTRGRTD
jgi:bifunctional DNA-binding transcriptional regulator/antitoxin component of YhaV-PrlF toxin-antitoxin module